MNSQQIKALIDAGDYEGAKAQIKDFFKQDWSEGEKGAVLMNSAHMYMKLMTEIYKQHNEELADLFAAMKDIDSTSKGINEDLKLAQVRVGLNNAK